MMTDVALVNPGLKVTGPQPPLNLGYIAGYLKRQNIEVVIIDERAGEKCENRLEKICPRIVGVTAVTSTVDRAYQIGDYVGKNLDALTVLGGVHASAMPKEGLEHFDKVVVGEGERAMLDIAKGRCPERIVSRPFVKNIDEIPPPARHLIDMNFYLSLEANMGERNTSNVGTLITSRGCPYRCIFCYNNWRNTPVRYHSSERVAEELDQLAEVYAAKAFYFHDDTFTANKKRVQKICELMIGNGLSEFPWSAWTRADLVDLEMLKMMKKAGCAKLEFGFESGSQRVLDVLKKGTTVEQNTRAIKLCKEAGIWVAGAFMIGNPSETLEEIRMTERFIEESNLDEFHVSITTPFPGTELWGWAKERGLISEPVDYSSLRIGAESPTASDKIPKEVLRKIVLRLDAKSKLRQQSKIELCKRAIKNPRLFFEYIEAIGSRWFS